MGLSFVASHPLASDSCTRGGVDVILKRVTPRASTGLPPSPVRAYLEARRSQVLAVAVALLIVVATADWLLEPLIPLRFFYILPIVFASGSLSRMEVAIFAVLCTAIRAYSSGEEHEAGELTRALTLITTYVSTGLFVGEVLRSHRQTTQLMRELQREQKMREDAEGDLRALVASTPIAVLTLDETGRVLHANEASHRLIGCDEGELEGQPVDTYLPDLRDAVVLGMRRKLKTSAPCRGISRNGDPIHAQAWFSTYETNSGRRLVAIVAEISEQFRDREESELQQSMVHSQAVVMALAHEVRNLSAAANLLYGRLSADGALVDNRNFVALGTVLASVGQIAAQELQLPQSGPLEEVDWRGLTEDLKVVLGPSLRDEGITISIELEPELPSVVGENVGLLQVLLNLARNSRRALPKGGDIRIEGHRRNDRVVLRFCDTGTGVPKPEVLFRAFQPGSTSTGLGLYISRAIVRNYGGELRYSGGSEGSCFEIDLPIRGDGRSVL